MSKKTKKNQRLEDLAATIAEMETMTVNQLQLRYAEVFGETTSGRSKGYLKKKIAKHLREQFNAGGKAATKGKAKGKAKTSPKAKTKQAKAAGGRGSKKGKAKAATAAKKARGGKKAATTSGRNAKGKAKAESGKTPTAKPKPKGRARSDRDPRLPAPGTVLTRDYRGTTYEVKVLEDGFEYEGELYASLSKIATQITGTSWNGFLFWGLGKRSAE